LLLIASATTPGGLGRAINIGSGVSLCLLGFGLYRLHGRFMRRETALAEGVRQAELLAKEEEEPVAP
jgi:hypothetical protein